MINNKTPLEDRMMQAVEQGLTEVDIFDKDQLNAMMVFIRKVYRAGYNEGKSNEGKPNPVSINYPS
jgi:hypothetical protein